MLLGVRTASLRWIKNARRLGPTLKTVATGKRFPETNLSHDHYQFLAWLRDKLFPPFQIESRRYKTRNLGHQPFSIGCWQPVFL
jgi:hypothetical protein